MMAYRKYRNYRSRGRTTHGKKFRTRKGRYGHYVYKNGRRVGFKSVGRSKRRY